MKVSAVVQDLAADLAALGELGDEAMASSARRLASAMQAPLTARLLEVIGQVATELNAVLGGDHAEVRLVGDDARLVVSAAADTGPDLPTGDQPAADGAAEGEARVTLRLPAQLKGRLEAAATGEGVSLNTYIVRALAQAGASGSGPGGRPRGPATSVGRRRLSGYGRS